MVETRKMRIAGISLALCGLLTGGLHAPHAEAQNANSTKAPELTTLWKSGSTGSKLDLVVIGDGFRDTTTDQNAFDDYVQDEVVDDLFASGLLYETKGAFNLYRINTFSTDSGVTQVDNNGNVTTARSTALDWRVSGDWRRCHNEPGPNTESFTDDILDDLVPGWDIALVVLNEPVGGGCRRGATATLHLASGAPIIRHELGHAIGLLCDEYTVASPTTYTGTEPGCVNLTTDTTAAGLKWGEYVQSSQALPTLYNSATMHPSETAGAFVGGTIGPDTFDSGIWHPTNNSTMNGNIAELGPINYEAYRKQIDRYLDYSFEDAATGDFDGDGRDDIVIQDDVSLWLHLSTGHHLGSDWAAGESVPGSWQFKDRDELHVGDFDGDGLEDLYIVNLHDWSIPYLVMLRSTGSGFEFVRRYDAELPGWDDMRGHDAFHVGDFDGDGRDDLAVFNGRDWSVGYLGLLRSTGTSLDMMRRYDEELPGWDDMRRGDQFFVGNFDGDEDDDLFVFNGDDWSVGYLGMLRSEGGTSLTMVQRYDEELPGWDDMRDSDEFYIADFDNDGGDDVYVINTRDWSVGYLGMLRSEGGTSLTMVQRYDEKLPGWDDLEPGDSFYVGDVDGDDDEDLYVFNHADWSTEYLGILETDGSSLSGSWQQDRVGDWNLGNGDTFLVANFNGGSGWADLYVRNSEWFGMLRSQSGSVTIDAIFRWWINDVEHHDYGWW